MGVEPKEESYIRDSEAFACVVEILEKVTAIFSICLWNYGLHTREVILKLISSMAAVPDKYLKGCLQMLVANFRPFRQIHNNKGADESDVHDELYLALSHITDLVPCAPLMLSEVIDQNMPRVTDSKEVISHDYLVSWFQKFHKTV